MADKPQSRDERLAAALRANLKRRKAAARVRTKAANVPRGETAPGRPNAAKKPD
jgi:hypothetical protein